MLVNAAEREDQDFIITRIFNAPRVMVWKAWTDPVLFATWWGPNAFTTEVQHMDVRQGGAYRLVMHAPDGVDYPMEGIFREVLSPERLVMTLDCSDHPAEWHDRVNPLRNKDEKPVFILEATVSFREFDGNTQVSVHIPFNSPELYQAMQQTGMEEAWAQSLARMAEGLGENVTARPPALVRVARHFDAPPEQVFDAWLDPEKARHFLFATPKGEMVKVEIDARIGGSFCIVEKRDGKDAEHIGKYLEIDRPHCLVFSFGGPGFPATCVTVEYGRAGAGCDLTLTHEGVWPDYASRTQQGWEMILDGLAGTVNRKAA
jgi:uncharacterized protein YndB with AHSA1/START domain